MSRRLSKPSEAFEISLTLHRSSPEIFLGGCMFRSGSSSSKIVNLSAQEAKFNGESMQLVEIFFAFLLVSNRKSQLLVKLSKQPV